MYPSVVARLMSVVRWLVVYSWRRQNRSGGVVSRRDRRSGGGLRLPPWLRHPLRQRRRLLRVPPWLRHPLRLPPWLRHRLRLLQELRLLRRCLPVFHWAQMPIFALVWALVAVRRAALRRERVDLAAPPIRKNTPGVRGAKAVARAGRDGCSTHSSSSLQ